MLRLQDDGVGDDASQRTAAARAKFQRKRITRAIAITKDSSNRSICGRSMRCRRFANQPNGMTRQALFTINLS